MNQRAERRRKNQRQSQAMFYDAVVDRRQQDRREQPVIDVPAIPGTIRPAPGEHVQVERRRFPESGTE
jgi:hypothetical protein